MSHERLESLACRLFTQQVAQTNNNEIIKAGQYWSFVNGIDRGLWASNA